MNNVIVVDAPCGSWKTRNAIKMINESKEDEKFLVIVLYLSEVERFKAECKKKRFSTPTINTRYKSKSEHLVDLIKAGKNIVATHALFHLLVMNDELKQRLNEYTLIMDEVTDVVEQIIYYREDTTAFLTMCKKYHSGQKITKKNSREEIIVDCPENGVLLVFDGSDKYGGMFKNQKEKTENDYVYLLDADKDNAQTVALLNPELFTSFNKVYVLTYLFKFQFQRYYFDFYKVQYEMYSSSEKRGYFKCDKIVGGVKYRDLIKVHNARGLDKYNERQSAFSKRWYDDATDDMTRDVKKACYSFFKRVTQTKAEDNMWTVFKEHRKKVTGSGYSQGFVSLNLKATNELKNKNSVAILINRYPNPTVSRVLHKENGMRVDSNGFALSEMIQLIFRSCIRDGKPITVFLPSKRMQLLLNKWLNVKYCNSNDFDLSFSDEEYRSYKTKRTRGE